MKISQPISGWLSIAILETNRNVDIEMPTPHRSAFANTAFQRFGDDSPVDVNNLPYRLLQFIVIFHNPVCIPPLEQDRTGQRLTSRDAWDIIDCATCDRNFSCANVSDIVPTEKRFEELAELHDLFPTAYLNVLAEMPSARK